jgi:glycosyltransferase involved in cell wall biosynthesis
MWCCVDDVCLSYRLSLPNKFFQALSVGIPVVATYGSYLAEIVEKYQLGFVFNGTNLSVIVEQMKSPAFAELGARVLAFRADLRGGNVVI